MYNPLTLSLPELLIFLAGIGQLILVGAGICVPFIFKWKEDLKKVQPLTRQIFWTYGGYILGANIFFALICLGDPQALLDQTFLALSFSFYLTLYWLVRLILHFTFFNREAAPQGIFISIGETVLVMTFVFLTFTYGMAFCHNLNWI